MLLGNSGVNCLVKLQKREIPGANDLGRSGLCKCGS